MVNTGDQLGSYGWDMSVMPASCGVLLLFFMLHSLQAVMQFSQLDLPPRDCGNTWSIDRPDAGFWRPQYWQANPSLFRMLRRANGILSRFLALRPSLSRTTTSGTRMCILPVLTT